MIEIATYCEEEYRKLNKKLDEIEQSGEEFIAQLKQSIEECHKSLGNLLQFVESHKFSSLEQEISFFKEMKPAVEGRMLYYSTLLRIELGRPLGTGQDNYYFEAELKKINQFFEENKFLVSYYRSGDTFLDDKLFVRLTNKGSLREIGAAEEASETLAGRFVARYIGSQKLADYLTKSMEQRTTTNNDASTAAEKPIKWTDSKVALIELLYAVYRKGSINNGTMEIKEIAKLFESVFHVDLGNYYRTIQEIRIRKTSRISYLDQLRTALIQYMDETDLNYKG